MATTWPRLAHQQVSATSAGGCVQEKSHNMRCNIFVVSDRFKVCLSRLFCFKFVEQLGLTYRLRKVASAISFALMSDDNAFDRYF